VLVTVTGKVVDVLHSAAGRTGDVTVRSSDDEFVAEIWGPFSAIA